MIGLPWFGSAVLAAPVPGLGLDVRPRKFRRLATPQLRMTSSSHQKCGCTQMPNSNDVASRMFWERVLSLLVVGASVLGERRVADNGVTTSPSRIYHSGRTSFEWQASQVQHRILNNT